jgi:acetamidase/formamidase
MTRASQIAEGDSYEDVRFDDTRIYHLCGPVAVRGARPGDTLRIDVLSLETGDWGWAAILPGKGLLADEFREPWLGTFDLRTPGEIAMPHGVTVPASPFLGVMGTHPDAPRSAPAIQPHKGGGNIDARHLVQGAQLWLPVWLDGAMFSCGDGHAAQGDGEVCVTGLECGMEATVRLTVERRNIDAPCFRTPGPLLVADEGHGHFGTMGIHGNLFEGARIAVRAALAWLQETQELTREEAYVLCSLVGDLKILEIVDGGVWNVGFTLPVSIFPTGRRLEWPLVRP